MQSQLIQTFYTVSQLLLTPVMCLLFLSMMGLVVACGHTVRLAVERIWYGRRWRNYMEQLRNGESLVSDWRKAAIVGMPEWFQVRCKGENDIESIKLRLPEAELIASRTLGRLQVFIRVGPMLGLIGTLLPLGPALQELSSSRLDAMGENLNVAFTTTVFGIAVGAVAYALHVVRRAWFERDLNDMECVLQILEKERTHE